MQPTASPTSQSDQGVPVRVELVETVRGETQGTNKPFIA
eukprot:SAG31_NODE_43504_length_267_cov_0.547619_1_plen_38_part_10